jgi:hypothetical protein
VKDEWSEFFSGHGMKHQRCFLRYAINAILSEVVKKILVEIKKHALKITIFGDFSFNLPFKTLSFQSQ